MPLGIGAERRQIDDRQIGDEGAEILGRRTDQEIADEERMPGVFGEDARAQAQRRVGAGVEVLGEQRLTFGVGDEIGEQGVEMLAPHRIVVVPPDDPLGLGVADDELVLRAASRMNPGVGDQRPMRGDKRLMALQRLLVKLRRAEIPVDRGEIAEAEPFRAEVSVARPILDHPDVPPAARPNARVNPRA